MSPFWRRLTPFVLAVAMAGKAFCQTPVVTGVDFADDPGKLYVPLRGMVSAMGLNLGGTEDEPTVEGKSFPRLRELFDGTKLVALDDLGALGAKLAWDKATQTATVVLATKTVTVHRGVKRAEISKAHQELRAYQGDILILQTHVSTGRKGHATPSGSFAAYSKERMHYSRLYDDAPMPWAVEIDGNVFIHGFTSVPRRPASHGCIRMPLRGKNAARYFWHWVSIGTPVKVG